MVWGEVHPWDPIKSVANQYDINLDAADWYDQLAERIGFTDHPTYDPENYKDLPEWWTNAPLDWFISPQSFNADDLSYRYGNAVSSQLSQYQDATVLDIGCAATTGVPAIAGENNTVIQADLDRRGMRYGEMLIDNTEHIAPSIHVQADGEELPFQDDTFDVIFAGAVLGEGENAMLSDTDHELYRVLRPEGDFLLASGYVGRSEDALHTYQASSLLEDGVFDAAYKEDSLLVFENYSP